MKVIKLDHDTGDVVGSPSTHPNPDRAPLPHVAISDTDARHIRQNGLWMRGSGDPQWFYDVPYVEGSTLQERTDARIIGAWATPTIRARVGDTVLARLTLSGQPAQATKLLRFDGGHPFEVVFNGGEADIPIATDKRSEWRLGACSDFLMTNDLHVLVYDDICGPQG